MRGLVWACCLIVGIASRADAGYVAEGAFASASRFSTNYNTPLDPPHESGPTYTLVNSGNLPTYRDLRGTGSFSDGSIKFALGSALPAGQTIVSASLTLNVALSFATLAGQAPTLAVAGFATTMNPISLADFDQPWMALGSQSVVSNLGRNLSNVPTALVYDVTGFLQSLQNAGVAAAGFQVDNLTNGLVIISPFDDPTLGNQPSLSIIYAASVPEPMSAVLMAAGLGIAGIVCRRGAGSAAALA